ncbi:MAG: ABC transporter permease, partial [Gammaproteobacteria bacterium]|nr:ABC transporter permease [Gammaproteobacteria bacterium]
SGLSAGLIKNNVSGLMQLPVSHIAFEYDDEPNYRASLVDRSMWEGWATRPGVTAAEPFGHTIFNARGADDEPLELALWGVRPGRFTEPAVTSGEQLGGSADGVIISRILAEKGVQIGDRITLDRVLTELQVIGITEEANIGHIPIVYAPLPKWQEATYGPPGGMPPGEKFPEVVYDYASVIALQLDEGLDTAAIREVDEELGTTTLPKVEDAYEASTGYIDEVRSVSLIQYALITIATVVIGAFFAIWTIQRTAEIGLVKALGASNAYLLRDSLGQAFLLLAAGTVVGLGGGLWVGQLFMKAGRPFMYVPETVAGAVISLLIAGLVGGALSIRRITAVDPIIALGRDR